MTRGVNPKEGPQEQAIYDLIFNSESLRGVAKRIGYSQQGVYIRALAYMKHWYSLGHIALDEEYFNKLKEE